MKILAVDTSSQSASCALLEDGKLLGEFFTNVHLTHSQTIMPMLENLLMQARTSLDQIDLFATAVGPGSFTGLRIGIAAVKGMAHALDKKCIGVSTLEALAYNLYGQDCIVAPVLDARCSQVYTALFSLEGEKISRLENDDALSITDLGNRLKNTEKTVFLVGDGAKLCYNHLKANLPHLALTSPALLYTRASSIALAANAYAFQGGAISPDLLAPAYLRLPQAERELRAKQSGNI